MSLDPFQKRRKKVGFKEIAISSSQFVGNLTKGFDGCGVLGSGRSLQLNDMEAGVFLEVSAPFVHFIISAMQDECSDRLTFVLHGYVQDVPFI